MTTVRMWTGREARALREAKRMTVREFAAHLGVSERTVSKWEAGAGDIQPRPEMQAALDTALEKASNEVTARFLQVLGEGHGPLGATPSTFAVQSHKFIPVFIGVEAAKQLAGRRSFRAQLESWLGCQAQPVQRPDGRAVLYVFACGVAVMHLRQRCDMGYIADLAAWRYATATSDLGWVDEQLASLLPEHLLGRPEPVTWLCWLEQTVWSDVELEAALRLLCMPSVLVDRDDPEGPKPVSDLVEQWHLATAMYRKKPGELSGIRWIRRATGLAVVGLAGIAGAISYSHMHVLASAHGESGWKAHTFPLSVDGIEIVASLVLVAHRRAGTKAALLPWLALGGGTVASLAANVSVGASDVIGRLVAGWPAVSFLIAVKLLFSLVDAHAEAEHTKGSDEPIPEANPAPVLNPSSTSPAPAPAFAAPVQQTRSARRPRRIVRTDQPDVMAAAYEIHSRAVAEGRRLTRDALTTALRRNGHSVSNARGSELIRILNDDSSLATPINGHHLTATPRSE